MTTGDGVVFQLGGVKEAAWLITRNSSLSCNDGTRITLSYSWDHSINTTQLFSIFDKFQK